MLICGIDANPETYALAVYDTELARSFSVTLPAQQGLARVAAGCGLMECAPGRYGLRDADVYVVERLQSYMLRVGSLVFDAQWNAALIYRTVDAELLARAEWISRTEVKRVLLGRVAGNDADVVGALYERFGPGRKAAVGTKAAPGPLHGVRKDEYQALAAALAWWDKNRGAVLTGGYAEEGDDDA